MHKVSLLDFDGVLFRNNAAMEKVIQRSDDFSRMHAPSYNPKDFDYRVHGHTVYMLQEQFGKKVTFQNYNDYVFDDSIFEFVRKTMTEEDVMRAQRWKQLLEDVREPSYIFSNAPHVWVHEILSITGLGESFDESRVMCSDTLGCLKPSPLAYIAAIDKVGHRDVLFYDDSKLNVEQAECAGIPSVHFTDDVEKRLFEVGL